MDFCGIQRLLYHPQLCPVSWDELSFSFHGTGQMFPKDEVSMSFSTVVAGVSPMVPAWLLKGAGGCELKQKPTSPLPPSAPHPGHRLRSVKRWRSEYCQLGEPLWEHSLGCQARGMGQGAGA